MRLLLDTHIALWAIVDDERLSSRARDLIGEPGNVIVVSAASIWEITIKHALARGGGRPTCRFPAKKPWGSSELRATAFYP